MLGPSLSSPSTPARRRQAGFTIIEVAMAAGVMAFAIATAIVAMQAGYKQIDLGRGTTLAAQIIQSEMERLRMMSFSQIAALPASETFDGATYFSANPEIAGKYSITRTITGDATRPTEVKVMGVAVRWRSYDGRWHTRSFNATYSQNGLYDYFYTVAHP